MQGAKQFKYSAHISLVYLAVPQFGYYFLYSYRSIIKAAKWSSSASSCQCAATRAEQIFADYHRRMSHPENVFYASLSMAIFTLSKSPRSSGNYIRGDQDKESRGMSEVSVLLQYHFEREVETESERFQYSRFLRWRFICDSRFSS